MPDEAHARQPVVLRRPEVVDTKADSGPSEDDARPVTPFQVINRGEDTVDGDDRVTFSDFRPTVLPADAVEEPEVEPVPKDESAPEPAPSAESNETTEQTTSETSAQDPANSDDGKPSPSEPSKSSSSTETNPG